MKCVIVVAVSASFASAFDFFARPQPNLRATASPNLVNEVAELVLQKLNPHTFTTSIPVRVPPVITKSGDLRVQGLPFISTTSTSTEAPFQLPHTLAATHFDTTLGGPLQPPAVQQAGGREIRVQIRSEDLVRLAKEIELKECDCNSESTNAESSTPPQYQPPLTRLSTIMETETTTPPQYQPPLTRLSTQTETSTTTVGHIVQPGGPAGPASKSAEPSTTTVQHVVQPGGQLTGATTSGQAPLQTQAPRETTTTLLKQQPYPNVLIIDNRSH